VHGSVPWFLHACRVPFCTTVSPRVQLDLGAVVEFEHHRARHHELVVDAGGGVHARMIGLHVGGHSGEGRLHRGERGLDVETLHHHLGGGRHGEQPEAEPSHGWEVGVVGRHRPVVGEAWWCVGAPQPEELEPRQQVERDRFDHLVARDHCLAFAGMSGDDASDAHGCPLEPLATPRWDRLGLDGSWSGWAGRCPGSTVE
jgi:hypothetical protein